MIAEGRTVLRLAPWLSILPGLALAFTVVGVYLAGEGLPMRLHDVRCSHEATCKS